MKFMKISVVYVLSLCLYLKIIWRALCVCAHVHDSVFIHVFTHWIKITGKVLKICLLRLFSELK